MRTSHKEIRKRIAEEKSRITDEEFFSSEEYRAYLTDRTEAAGRRYGRTVPVIVYADREDETVAYTDYSGIFINACNHITMSFPSRRLRAMSIDGFCSHEQGHLFFTDSRIWQTHSRKLGKGRFYPAKPAGVDRTHAAELLAALTDGQDPVPRMVILQTAHALENIAEDGFVDMKMSLAFPGSPARGIALNNSRFAELVPDISEMQKRGYFDHNIVLNLLIQYVRVGEINNLSGYRGELLDTARRFLPSLDASITDPDARNRCRCTNQILVGLWPIMQRSFDTLRDQYREALQRDQQENAACGDGSQASAGQDSGEQGETDSGSCPEAEQVLTQILGSQLPAAAPDFEAVTSPVTADGAEDPTEDTMKQIRASAEQIMTEDTESGEGSGQTDSSRLHSGEDMERLLEQIAEHHVSTEMEEALAEELCREAREISYGDMHKGISVNVNRMSHVSEELITAYDRLAPDLLPLSRRLQQRVRPLIEDKRQGGKETGLYYGKHLDARSLYRTDGRWFYSTSLPAEPLNIRVALVCDESGSMSCGERITRSRETAIVVHDFCTALGIPVMIIGHTAWNGHVELYSYADFDSVDRMDRYRLMDMSARDCNRDGAAIRFAAEKLSREQADVKLMFIISDGQPNDGEYTGPEAEADLRAIRLEYTRKGIRVYAAAIGEDRENIERIYRDRFLDITDIRNLPVLFTNLIAGSLPL